METWTHIETLGRELGATEEMIRKWRVRGVPHTWRLRLLDAADDAGVPLDRRAFDLPPGPKTKQIEAA
jgi:hypothetical protein